MKNDKDKIIKDYIKEIKLYLPLYKKSEKRFLTDMRTILADYATSNDFIDREILVNNFGEPKEIALTYIGEQDSEILRTAIMKSKYTKRAIIFITLLTFILISTKFCLIYNAYKDAANSYIGREIITIDE